MFMPIFISTTPCRSRLFKNRPISPGYHACSNILLPLDKRHFIFPIKSLVKVALILEILHRKLSEENISKKAFALPNRACLSPRPLSLLCDP